MVRVAKAECRGRCREAEREAAGVAVVRSVIAWASPAAVSGAARSGELRWGRARR